MTDIKEVKESKVFCDLVVKGMLEMKASQIAVLDFANVTNAVADYFIVCSGGSDTQIDAIADSVEDEVYKVTNSNPWKKEGKENKEWILIDYGNVVVHIFRNDRREFYALEKLWGDADISYIDEEN